MLSNELVETSDSSYLIDYQKNDELLIICFGFYNAAGPGKFDFFSRLKKLENISSKKINKLLLRDSKNLWYCNGIEGLGGNVDECLTEIRKIITSLKPSAVITIGQSMGGYAAIMFGALLNVDKAISFGPLSCIDSKRLESINDQRWLPIVKNIELLKMPPSYTDLPKLISESKSKTQFEIFYGTNPGHGANANEAVNYDAAHALAFYELDQVKLFPFHNSPHTIVEYMRVNKIIDDLLLNRIFNIPISSTIINKEIGEAWSQWIEENIRYGVSDNRLIETLTNNNFNYELSLRALNHIRSIINLQSVLK